MRSSRIFPLLFTIGFLCGGLTACGSPCSQGYGLAQNGDCRPFQTGEEADADADADADSDTDTDLGEPSSGDLEMIGEWMTDLEESHTITNETWVVEFYLDQDDVDVVIQHNIESFWNNNNFLVAYNLDTNRIDGGLYSRFDWVIDGNEAYFCPTACCASSSDEALNSIAPDPSDPASFGCGDDNTEWTRLTRQ